MTKANALRRATKILSKTAKCDKVLSTKYSISKSKSCKASLQNLENVGKDRHYSLLINFLGHRRRFHGCSLFLNRLSKVCLSFTIA